MLDNILLVMYVFMLFQNDFIHLKYLLIISCAIFNVYSDSI